MFKKTALAFFTVVVLAILVGQFRVVFADDTTAPTSTLVKSPASPDGQNSWYISPINLTITGDDLDSGIKSINWLIDGDLNSQTFNNTLNQILNPSFEDIGSPIDKWDKTNDDGIALFSQDATSTPPLDANSAKVESTTTGWHGFNNKSNYAVVSTYQNMTSSVWIKTQGVTGTAFYKIFLLYDDGNGQILEQLIASSTTVTGTTAWQKISLNFIVNNAQAVGVYIDVGLNGQGIAWFDGAAISSSITNPSANFSISSNGNHTLEYYSIDNADNEELPHQNTTFKIDTKAPSRWTNFTLTQSGNDHTFVVSIKVTDTTSGLDISTAEFQYSVNQGATWGYYSNLGSCNGTFTQSWRSATVTPNTDGSTQVTFNTPAIDFCNNNWATTKKIRFRIYDMAGNLGQSADFAINGSWIRVDTGEIFSNEGINFQSASTVTYASGARLDISNVTSTNNWFTENYESMPFENYAGWYAKYPTTTAPPNNRLPNTSGRFRVNSDFTIASNTIPNGLSSIQNLSAVLFVNGDLNINSNYSLHNTSGIIIIVNGDITVANGVSAIDGFYIANGEFDVGSGSTQLTINGGVQADSFNLKRSLNGNQNTTTPAEIFTYRPKYLIVGRNQLGADYTVSFVSVE